MKIVAIYFSETSGLFRIYTVWERIRQYCHDYRVTTDRGFGLIIGFIGHSLTELRTPKSTCKAFSVFTMCLLGSGFPPLSLGSRTVPGLSYSNSRLIKSLTHQPILIDYIDLSVCPTSNISDTDRTENTVSHCCSSIVAVGKCWFAKSNNCCICCAYLAVVA
jgi:hypothetical protein